MRSLDLRLAPAAVLAWIAAWAATGGTGATALAVACGWLAALAGAGAIALAGMQSVTRGGAVASVVVHVALAAACSLGVVATATVTTARAAAIQELADGRFTAELTGTVVSQPEPVSWGGPASAVRAGTADAGAIDGRTADGGTAAGAGRGGGDGAGDGAAAERGAGGPVRFMLDVREVTARGVTTAARARVTVTWTPPVASKPETTGGGPARGGVGGFSSASVSDAPGSGSGSGSGSGEDVVAASSPRFGSVVVVRGGLRPAEPGGPESARLTADVLAVQRSPPAPLRLLDRHRDTLMAVTGDLAPQARGLVPGAAIGDTTRLSDELAEAMKLCGLTHITAVSGGHFSIVIAVLTGIAAMFGAPRWARVVLLAVAGAAFVALVRPEPSVLRAAVMAGFAMAGIVLGRPAQSVPALAGTVIGLLVADPWLSRSFGFALSAAATAGLVLLVPPLVARIAPWTGKAFAFALAVPLAAQAACGPVLVLLDPEASLVSVPANLLAAPALVPATVLGLAATVLAPWWPWGAHLVAWVAGGATWWIAQVALHGAALPGRAVPWPGGPAGAVLLAVATAAALAVMLLRRPRGWPDPWRRAARSGLRQVYLAVSGAVPGARSPSGRGFGRSLLPHGRRGELWLPASSGFRATPGGASDGRARGGAAGRAPGGAAPRGNRLALPAGIVLVGVMLGAVVLTVPRMVTGAAVPQDWVVAACDVGQGDGLAVRTGPASAVVVDVGPDGDAAGRCLDRLGVTRVDLLVLSHFHADHVGGLTAVLDGREVESALVSTVAEPEANATRTLDELASAGVPVRSPVAGERGTAGNVSWDVLLAGLPAAPAGGTPGDGTSLSTASGPTGAGPNDASVTLLVRVAGLDVVLLGDLEDAGQQAVLSEARSRGIVDVDVVKVAHHGSRVQSQALAEQLSPAVALVSAGRDNGYGHPTDTALDLYERVGAEVLRTDECGTFALVVRDDALAVGGC
ncbi:hypothetical protein GCM10027059_39750 [Myceligenerans halotolerans]